MALKIRLNQLESAEMSVLQEFRKEREFIFKRLRELDEKEAVQLKDISDDFSKEFLNYQSFSSAALEEFPGQIFQRDRKLRKSRPSRRSKSSKMREVAIHILQEKAEPIRGVDLQRIIEERTGFKIANMTSFMKTVEKVDPRICKPNRGLYQFLNPVQDEAAENKPVQEELSAETAHLEPEKA
jgi:hypothetical protein